MRVFLCVFGNFSLAIPITYISSIMLYYGNSGKKIEYDNESRNTYVSLPVLFDYQSETPRHGIILKNEEDEDSGIIENKTILLTTEIEREINIPEEKIYTLPKILDRMKFSRIFNGIVFGQESLQDKKMLLLLNPELLINNLQKELI